MNYQATFSNGATITRTSDRKFTHAYRAHTSYANQVRTGFAASEKLARASGNSQFSLKYFSDCDVEVVPVVVS